MTMQMNNRSRIIYLDLARVLTMFLVVWGHFYNGDNIVPHHYIFSFHMPLFFLVSGMLHKYVGHVLWVKYMKTLLLPVLFFNIICGIFLAIVKGGWIHFIDAYIQMMVDKKFFVDGPTWFLLVLFYCRIITDYFAKYPIGILVFWLVGFILIDQIKVFQAIFLPQAFMAFPFYVIGYKYKDNIGDIVNSKHACLGGGNLSIVNIGNYNNAWQSFHERGKIWL